MKLKDMRKLNAKELDEKQVEMRKELSMLKGQAATGTPPKSPGLISKLKRNIARIKTINYEREINELESKISESDK